MNSGTIDSVLEEKRETVNALHVIGNKEKVSTFGIKLIGLKAMRCTARLRRNTPLYLKLNDAVNVRQELVDNVPQRPLTECDLSILCRQIDELEAMSEDVGKLARELEAME